MKTFTHKTLLCILGLTLLVFSRTLSFDFVNLDDPSHLDNNPSFQNLSVKSIGKLWVEPHLLYMPVTYTVWGAVAALSAKNPPAVTATGVSRRFRYHPFLFHLCTLFFHLVSVALVFHLLQMLGLSLRGSAIGTILFAIHPLQTEPVSWVSGLKDTLSTTFFLTALLFYLQRTRRAYWLACVAFAGALLSKPNTVIFPFFVFVIDFVLYKRPLRAIAPRLFPFVAMAAPLGLVTNELQATKLMSYVPPSIWQRPIVALDAIFFYLQKTLLPIRLTVDYGRTPAEALSSPLVYLWSSCALIFIAAFLYFFRKHRYATASGTLFLISLLPILGFKPFSFQTTSTVSDRYLYLGFVALALGIGHFVDRVQWTRKLAATITTLIVALASQSFIQTGVWRNTASLFQHCIQVNPKSWLSYNNLGSFYERDEKYGQAIAHYEKATAIKPMSLFYNNIGSIHMALKRFDLAIDAYNKSLELSPNSSIDLNGLGFAWLYKGEKKKAQVYFQRALALNPNLLQARAGLSYVTN